MQNRPTSITIISWLLIVSGLFYLIMLPISLHNPMVRELMAKSPLPIWAQLAMGIIGVLISIISATAMLKGKNWGRMLYIVGAVLGFTISLFTSPMKSALIVPIIVLLLVVFFLFRPAANAYFSEKTTD